MNGQIIKIADMVKQLNFVWLTAEIKEKQLQNTSEYINRIRRTCYSFYLLVLLKFYSDVITRNCLQLINTSIDTFFRKLCAFLAEQKRRRKANDG